MHINGRSGVLTKVVLEVKYRDGYVFLDRCGRIINQILREYPEWLPKGVDPQNAGLVSMHNGCTLGFSSLQYTFLLEKSLGDEPLSSNSIDTFTEQIETITPILHDQLTLRAFTRIGCRAWYMFGADSKEDAEKWLVTLPCWQINPKLAGAFGGQVSSVLTSIGISAPEVSYRISISAVERQAQIDLGQEILSVRASALSKNQHQHLIEQQKTRRRLSASPQFAVMIDLDAFHDEPPSIDPKNFVSTSLKHFENYLPKALS